MLIAGVVQSSSIESAQESSFRLHRTANSPTALIGEVGWNISFPAEKSLAADRLPKGRSSGGGAAFAVRNGRVSWVRPMPSASFTGTPPGVWDPLTSLRTSSRLTDMGESRHPLGLRRGGCDRPGFAVEIRRQLQAEEF